MTITPDELAASQRLEEAATPGPWTAYSPQVTWRIMARDRYVMESNGYGVRIQQDAAFIAHARTFLPKLREAYKAQQQAVSARDAECEEWSQRLKAQQQENARLRDAMHHAEQNVWSVVADRDRLAGEVADVKALLDIARAACISRADELVALRTAAQALVEKLTILLREYDGMESDDVADSVQFYLRAELTALKARLEDR